MPKKVISSKKFSPSPVSMPGVTRETVDIPSEEQMRPRQIHGYLRQKKLIALLPFSSATLWRKVKAGTFVKPVKLSARITAWNTAEVCEWLKQQGGK